MRKRARIARRLFKTGEDALARRVLWGTERKLSYKQRRSFRRWLWPLLAAMLSAGVAMAVAIYAAILNSEGPIDHKVRQILDMLFEAWRYITT